MKEVEIGLINRETKEVLTTTTEKENQIYYSIGMDFENGKTLIYAFESNAVLMELKEDASDATIKREFLKKYKLLKPNAVKRYRNGETIL